MDTFKYEIDKLGIINHDINQFIYKYMNKTIIDRGDNYYFIENGLVVRYILNNTLKSHINSKEDIKKLKLLNDFIELISNIQDFSKLDNASDLFNNDIDVNIDTFECGCIYSKEYPCDCYLDNGKWIKRKINIDFLENEMDIN